MSTTKPPRRSTGDRIRAFTARFNRKPKSAIEKQRIVKEQEDVNGNLEPSNVSAHDSGFASGSGSGTASASISTASSGAYAMRAPLHRRHSGMLAADPSFKLPDLPWLCGTWHVTHSTLPMWRNKRNVRIAYTRLPGNRLDDLVTYQRADGTEVKKVHGVDKTRKDGTYTWRGKGMLRVASSKWEVLGWGGGGADPKAEQWVVTYFARTGFTPAGIDVYARKQEGLSERTMAKLREALDRLDQGPKGGPPTEFGKLVASLFEVKRDMARGDIRVD